MRTHNHPDANQWALSISGEVESPSGNPKGKEYAFWKGGKVNKEGITLVYYDGPSTKVFTQK